jgi:hypothetical protein
MDMHLIWVRREAKYFCNQLWTAQISLNAQKNLASTRKPYLARLLLRVTLSLSDPHRFPPGREPLQSARWTPALVRIRDSSLTSQHIRKVAGNGHQGLSDQMSVLYPDSEVAAHLDHFVGAAQRCCWHIPPECLCGFQVDNHLELRRKLDRQIGRFGASSATVVGGQKRRLW